DALAERDRAAASRSLPFAILERLGEEARAGAELHDARSAFALEALDAPAIERALARALAGREADEVAKVARRTARRVRDRALDAALARHRDRLDELATEDVGAPHAEALAALTGTWTWAGRDPLVARFAVERAVPLAWVVYNARRWPGLQAIDRALAPLIDAFATRIAADPAELAYAGPCAQLLVFRAELAAPLETQLAAAERAVEVCGTHRNGRLVLADLLVLRGERALTEAPPFGRRRAREQALADYCRARELFPGLTALPRLEARLRREGISLAEDDGPGAGEEGAA
ncbi:MAG: hypothetical protein AAGH15_15820, partial [Myxococcota bacterium]